MLLVTLFVSGFRVIISTVNCVLIWHLELQVVMSRIIFKWVSCGCVLLWHLERLVMSLFLEVTVIKYLNDCDMVAQVPNTRLIT